MIDKKEYRLNNLVWVEGHNTYDKITNIDLDDDYVGMSMLNCNCHIDMLHPISLSQEWLEKLGFEKDRNGWLLPGTQLSLTDKLYPCWLDRMIWPQDIPDFQQLSLKYVHQLMNLYHALTGTELVINH